MFEKIVLQSICEDRYTSERAKERLIPVTYKDVANKSAVSILEEYVMLWAPQDLRLDPSYQAEHEVIVTDDLFTQDIIKGMQLKIEERIPTQNMIKVAVLFQHNMSEFERYNDVCDSHNKKWVAQGCREDVFDPSTGDILDVEDKYVNHAGDDSPCLFGESTGPLASARPSAKRRKLLTITYKLDIDPENRSLFNLEFIAEDYRGRIVYYNCLKNKNLAYLTRRATQELYGNPEVYGDTGPFYEGISMLVTGKKLRKCYDKNEKPGWAHETIKSPVIEQATLAAGSSGLKTAAYMIRYLTPVCGLIFIIGRVFYAIKQETVEGLFLHCFISLLTMYASIILSGILLRRAYSLDMGRRFT
jgi:hypothetical protein